jgi:hypothetical protein
MNTLDRAEYGCILYGRLRVYQGMQRGVYPESDGRFLCASVNGRLPDCRGSDFQECRLAGIEERDRPVIWNPGDMLPADLCIQR